MSKVSVDQGAWTSCGVDVSAATLTVAVERVGMDDFDEREFANTAAGHRQLVAWLLKRGPNVRVALEAAGIYSLDLALALDRAEGIEVAVLNPKTVHRFAQTLRRSKTDRADAVALAEYSRRMPFVAWRQPSWQVLELRALSRHIASLTEEHTRSSNRLHAAEGSATTPGCVRQDLKRSMISGARPIRQAQGRLWSTRLVGGVEGIGEWRKVRRASSGTASLHGRLREPGLAPASIPAGARAAPELP